MARRQKPRRQPRHLSPDIFGYFDENFGLNYDPSHFVWQQMDWLALLEEFASCSSGQS